jgi:hypothetical protein
MASKKEKEDFFPLQPIPNPELAENFALYAAVRHRNKAAVPPAWGAVGPSVVNQHLNKQTKQKGGITNG